jgi:hypothetical protein
MSAPSPKPCQFCQRATLAQLFDNTPCCDVCLKAFKRGRYAGLSEAVDAANKFDPKPRDVIDALKKLM